MIDRDPRRSPATTAGTSEALGSVGGGEGRRRSRSRKVTNLGYDNTENVLRQLSNKKPGLLIAHASGWDPIAARLAQQTGIPTITYDNPKLLVKGKVGVITTSSQQGGYLAGHPRREADEVRHRRRRDLGG